MTNVYIDKILKVAFLSFRLLAKQTERGLA